MFKNNKVLFLRRINIFPYNNILVLIDIYQGDILLTPVVEQYLLERLENGADKKVIHSRKKRALTSVLPLWNKYKNGIYSIVPYVVNQNIGK